MHNVFLNDDNFSYFYIIHYHVYCHPYRCGLSISVPAKVNQPRNDIFDVDEDGEVNVIVQKSPSTAQPGA